MESFSPYLTILGLLIVVITISYKRSIRHNTKKDGNKLEAPQPSGALPLVGHLHLLQGQAPLARTLGKFTDDYGPIYSLRFGSHRALVVSSWEMVKECFTTNDRNFATRPNLAVSHYMFYDNAGFVLAQYGPYWREIRKLVTSELFTSQRLKNLKGARNLEVKNSVNELYVLLLKDGDVIEMNKMFDQITFNINIRMIIGETCFNKSSFENAHVRETIKKGLYLMGVFPVSDFIPYLESMDIGGHLKAMEEVNIELDRIIRKWVDQHVEKTKELDNNKETDFMDVMLSKLSKDAEMFGHGWETIIKATTMTLMLTGSDSTALTMTWALSLLLNHPNILKAAQTEIDIHVGREKWVEESDIINLNYLQAVVKETLRMYPPGPLVGPHEAIDDCNVGGYHVQKGTRLIVNAWKLHRNAQVWSNPNEFRPERFLENEKHSKINYQGQNFEYIPFSTGRRMCPATSFAIRLVHLTLARLLQGFDFSTPMGKPVDMSEGIGIALPKVKPLKVIITPRLASQLYM